MRPLEHELCQLRRGIWRARPKQIGADGSWQRPSSLQECLALFKEDLMKDTIRFSLATLHIVYCEATVRCWSASHALPRGAVMQGVWHDEQQSHRVGERDCRTTRSSFVNPSRFGTFLSYPIIER